MTRYANITVSGVFHDHPSIQALYANAGSAGVLGFLKLAAYAKGNRSNWPSFAESDDINGIAGWTGDHAELLNAICDAGLAEQLGGNLVPTDLARMLVT
jgi:hypothetical protein